MAGKGLVQNEAKVEKVIAKEKKAVEKKRKVTGDARWLPANRAGMMPESEWKKYSPDSKKPKDYVEPKDSDDL